MAIGDATKPRVYHIIIMGQSDLQSQVNSQPSLVSQIPHLASIQEGLRDCAYSKQEEVESSQLSLNYHQFL